MKRKEGLLSNIRRLYAGDTITYWVQIVMMHNDHEKRKRGIKIGGR